MSNAAPVYLGRFAPMKAGDIQDLYIDIAADLVEGEAIEEVTFVVTGADGKSVECVGVHNETETRTDFRITVPTAGAYTLTAVFDIDDGQKITKTATLRSV